MMPRMALIQSLTQTANSLPPNLAQQIPVDQLQKIFQQIFSDFVWPQVTARLPFEEKWNRLQRMYKIQREHTSKGSRQNQSKENQLVDTKKEKPTELADTLIFDTVDRLKNLNFFICWKDQPVQYNRPRYVSTPLEDQFYNPTTRKIKSANALLEWNNLLQNVRQKHLALAQHFYLYGLCFVHSDFVLNIDPDQSDEEYLAVTNIGTSFEPISLRKLWLNPQLPINEMDKQICPFFFDLQVRGTILKNKYHPIFNPFGFVNLDKLNTAAYLFGPEAKSFTDAMSKEASSIQTQMRPEFSGEALWTFYPFLQLPGDQNVKRYIVQCYANNLFSGKIIPLRIQELYTVRKRLPLFGASHIPDLDSGLYTPSIAELLESHYDEIVRAKTQFLLNKDWINNPPTEVLSGSPAANDPALNTPGHTYEVTGPGDVSRRVPYDATNTTIEFINQAREQAQTSGKAVDAILGKAMGGRTTATEASNAFQASMSGVTSDVDNFTMGTYGEYARRNWENAGKFLPLEVINKICGNVDAPPVNAQDLAIFIGIRSDVGSTFIESIVKQQQLQQAIISSTTSPYLDQPTLWKALFRELKLTEALDAVKDNGFEMQVQMAYDQAVQTYMGKMVNIDPSQDHQIAIQVKTRFLQDTNSNYNQDYAASPSPVKGLTVTQYLAQQIQIHQQFVLLQQQQQMMMMQAQLHDERQGRIQDQQHQLQMKSTPKPSAQATGQQGQQQASPQPQNAI